MPQFVNAIVLRPAQVDRWRVKFGYSRKEHLTFWQHLRFPIPERFTTLTSTRNAEIRHFSRGKTILGITYTHIHSHIQTKFVWPYWEIFFENCEKYVLFSFALTHRRHSMTDIGLFSCVVGGRNEWG